jgi:hypothetical protein
MKTSSIGIVSGAILMLVAGVGIGTAQAAGNQSDSPAWSIADQIETGNLPEPAQVAESQQIREPVETGSLPDKSDVTDLDHSALPIEGNIHQYWGSDNPSN